MAFCKKIRNTVKKVIANADNYLLNNAAKAVEIVERIKAVANSPVIDVLTALIPGETDNNVIRIVRSSLVVLSDTFGKIEDCNGKTGEEKILCLINTIAALPKHFRDAVYLKISSVLAASLDGGRFSGSEYDLAVQVSYLNAKA